MPRSRTSAAATTSRARVADVAPPTVERLWTIGEVSAFLGIPIATLHQWRYLGTGPDAYRVGKHLRYSPVAVQAWLESECRREVSA
ncbi:helix-turn-helix transcriptional regulator [Actinotalea fermentans]|jgi:hypothetical protein|uniref:Helix-turn-helix domain-containing protein n=1 Tax=Actinotalea fermentans TaxID=43671 RepID=A0A511YYE4_9CELL|nr:helix-turn-helix domain-containing protein [Actinotalea fermentans]GEN80222.1 hypothetical protein AFE02nite_19560 [Actinotalea fermentans]HMO11170.1 helix-turn-helix domain-containing protein [Actinotalea sp.]